MFFGYFLNIKKVTPSADSVIGPAKAEAFLFPTRGFRSRPGPCSRSVAFRLRRNRAGRLPAPPFGFAAQNRARHFAARNHPVRLSASRPWLRHPAPLFCRSRRGCAAPGPQRQKPRPLLPFGRISPAAKPRGRSSAPPGPLSCRSRHGCAAPGPQRQNPGALWSLS